jgi:hypothetical protein
MIASFVGEKNQRILLISRIDLRGKALDDEEQKGDAKQESSELGELLLGDEIKFSLKV